MVHCTVGFLVVEVSNGDFGMETQQKPINEKA